MEGGLTPLDVQSPARQQLNYLQLNPRSRQSILSTLYGQFVWGNAARYRRREI
jgi:hypothetical protein